jgi:cell division protein FtsW
VATAAIPVSSAMPAVRYRWRMGVEARAIVLVTAVLLAFGVAVLYSASAIVAMQADLPSYFYLWRQFLGILFGLFVFAVFAKVDAERWSAWAWPVMIFAIVTMLVIILPGTEGIARRVNGSRRFLFGTSFQPSELAKFAVIIWTAMLVVKKGATLRRLTKGLLPFLIVVGILDFLAILEPDLSVAMMFTLSMGIILFAGGARIGHFVLLAGLAIPALWQQVERLQYTLLRMASFLDAGSAPSEYGYQLKQSLIAVGSGGIAGVGFGEGRQQYGFLPLPQTDFIGSNIGEEWGFIGMLLVIALFTFYGWLGMRIASQARSMFLRLTAVGITTMMVITAYLHLGVVIGLLPTTGLTLPFVSYGRSNLVLSLFMTGILVNIGSSRERVVGEHASNPLD